MNNFTIEFLISKILYLCEKNNTNPNQLGLQSGAGKSFVDNLKKGSFPAVDKIYKVANYFDCSIDYLLGRSENPMVNNSNNINQQNIVGNATAHIAPNTENKTDSDAQELLDMIKQLSLVQRAEIILKINEMLKFNS